MKNEYLPEGRFYNTSKNLHAISSIDMLSKAKETGQILEAKAILCDTDHNLIVDLPCAKGFIPHSDGAIGIDDGTTNEIALLTCVNRPICFKVVDIKQGNNKEKPIVVLSRRAAQEEAQKNYISNLNIGDVIDARVTSLSIFGAFADIACGIIALLPAGNISISNICQPKERFRVGQYIKAIVKQFDEQNRVLLSHRELLGTWKENAVYFSPQETFPGIIRSIYDYGIFVELAPNLLGVADYKEGVTSGQSASVFIRSINPNNMKIKVNIVKAFDDERFPAAFKYYIPATNHLDHWLYSPVDCKKVIETHFTDYAKDV